MAELVWAPRAAQNLERLYNFLTEKNPPAAGRAVQALVKGVASLSSHPEIGRPFDNATPELREWVIPFGNSAYVLLYEYDGEQVTILAMRHGREAGY
jgi:addiction module RelE/StbE family toxin